MQVIGSEKMASGQPNRKAKWCKMQVVGVKIKEVRLKKAANCMVLVLYFR